MSKENTKKYKSRYQEIMKSQKDNSDIAYQWSSVGDYFEKYSLFDEYTPVKISNETLV